MKEFSDFDLTGYNSYRINARCKKAYFLESEQDVIAFYRSKEPYILLGSGHNVIFSKNYYTERFLIFNGNFDNTIVDANSGYFEAEAGCTMLTLSELALENSLSGLEIFYDIPSSLGGAVVMNAGASGEEIKDILVKVRYLDLADMQIKEILKENMGFEYRNSFFQKNTDKIVLKAWFQLRPGNREDIWSKMQSIKVARWEKQPKDFPNAGSVFKRPPGHYVGAMIDELGLKGYQVGDAQISTKHSGFIVNLGNASGKDIIQIIEHVKLKVRDKFQVDLEVEQRII